MQNHAVSEAWWSFGLDDAPPKYHLTTLKVACQTYVQFSCRTFLLLGVVIVSVNQASADTIRRHRSWDFRNSDWLNLEIAKHGQKAPRLTRKQSVAFVKAFYSL